MEFMYLVSSRMPGGVIVGDVTLRPWTGTKGQVHEGRWSDNYFRGVAVLAALTRPAHWSLLDHLYIFGDHVE